MLIRASTQFTRQLKMAWDPVRRYAALVFILCIVLVFVFAFAIEIECVQHLLRPLAAPDPPRRAAFWSSSSPSSLSWSVNRPLNSLQLLNHLFAVLHVVLAVVHPIRAGSDDKALPLLRGPRHTTF